MRIGSIAPARLGAFRSGAACLAAAALGLGALASTPARAQVLAEMTPSQYNLTVRPGETVTRTVVVRNLGTVGIRTKLRIVDWGLDESGGTGIAAFGTKPNTLQGTVTFTPAEIVLGPGQNGRVQLTLTLPADGAATRWGMLLAQVQAAAPDLSLPKDFVYAELGTTLFLSRVPLDDSRPEITRLDVQPVGRDSVTMSVWVHNGGQRHFYVSGEAALADTFGVTVLSGPFAPGVVLPGSVRCFAWTGRAPLRSGRYVASATLDTHEPQLIVTESTVRWPIAARPPAALSAR